MEELIKILDTTNNEEFYVSKNIFDKIEEAQLNGATFTFNGLIEYIGDDSIYKRLVVLSHDKNRFKRYEEKEN